MADFKEFSIDLENLKYIEEYLFNRIKNYTISQKDIYLSNAGTIGLVGIIPKLLENKSLTENSSKITEIDTSIVNQKFLMYLLSLKISQKQIEKETLIVGVPKLSLERIAKLRLPIPPKAIQEKVIKLMDEALEKRAKNKQKAKELIDSIDSYVLNELGISVSKLSEKKIFNVKVEELENERFDVEYHQEKYKKIEKALERGKYELREIKDLVDYIKKGIEVGSKKYIDNGKWFFRVANIKNFSIIKDNKKYISEDTFKEKIEFKPMKEEILLSKDGSIGYCLVLEEEIDGIISSGIVRIKTNNKLNNYFLNYVLINKYIKLLLERLSIGQIIKHLKISDIENIKIPLPPKEIQEKIANEVRERLEKARDLKQQDKRGIEKAKQEIENILLG